MTNHLAGSTSPYLLQHADNPVDWYPWGSEAMERARRENKPIFLSIGYAACHWCHVMAHESFEDSETAALMNAHFVSIKVDREERPDLDSIYMSAVTALSGQGGWPMSVFLTPDLVPFYGGTYFPYLPSHGLPAFKELLQALSQAWTNQREEIDRVSADVTARLTGIVNRTAEAGFEPDSLASATDLLMKSLDREHGGWGGPPKFPQAMTIEFLLRRATAGTTDALDPAVLSLRAMAQGGMYDALGGGFSRYSTDELWRVPHFEKMLYDNALLARVYLHAWQMTGEAAFREVTEATLDFVLREMISPEGGFFSSLDADSEGQEGKFYVWTLEGIRSILGEKSELFERTYGVNASSNWEGRIVLQRALDDSTLASSFHMTKATVRDDLAAARSRLFLARSQRPRPATDDKVLTVWNGLMLAALAEAARALGRQDYLDAARKNAEFLITALRPEGQLRRSWRKGTASQAVFLEDYAALILGLLGLYQADFDVHWFRQATGLTEEMLRRFSDPAGGFFDTPSEAERVITRPKELQDNSVPCGNSLAAEALLQMAAFTGQADVRIQAIQALSQVAEAAPRYPTAFAHWLSAADFAFGMVKQVAIMGNIEDDRTQALVKAVNKDYHPNMVITAAPVPLPPGSPLLLEDRPLLQDQPTAYVCEGFVCRLPVNTPEGLARQL